MQVVGHNQAKIKSSPFGDGKTAMKFNAANGTQLQVTSVPTADKFGTSDFTIEFWLIIDDHESDSGDPMIFDGGDTSNSGGFTLQLIRTDGDLRVYDGDAAATVLDDGTPGFRAVEFRWHHYACVRISNVMYVYLDGVQMGSATVTSDFDSSIWTWGKYRGGDAYNILGYLDEIRIVVGTGVYTGPFAVPTARFSGSGQSAGASGSNTYE